jgi:Prolyl oligopeptidase family
MLRYDKFTGGHFWVTEYGSSSDPEQFKHLIKYSPLHNIKPGVCYTATLVTTADYDDRVVPSHSYKFTAALQVAQGCDKPALIRVETKGSHGYRPTDSGSPSWPICGRSPPCRWGLPSSRRRRLKSERLTCALHYHVVIFCFVWQHSWCFFVSLSLSGISYTALTTRTRRSRCSLLGLS